MQPFKRYIDEAVQEAVKDTNVFDKIRAEIEEIETYDGIYIDRVYVLEILDKYKSESEPCRGDYDYEYPCEGFCDEFEPKAESEE